MKNVLILIAFTIVSTASFGQNKQKLNSEYIVLEHFIDDIDLSLNAVKGKEKVVFYSNDDKLMLSIYVSKNENQRFGEVLDLDYEAFEETENAFAYDVFNFKWSFITNFDDQEKIVDVTFFKIYKPHGVSFTLEMIDSQLSKEIIKGYMDGSQY